MQRERSRRRERRGSDEYETTDDDSDDDTGESWASEGMSAEETTNPTTSSKRNQPNLNNASGAEEVVFETQQDAVGLPDRVVEPGPDFVLGEPPGEGQLFAWHLVDVWVGANGDEYGGGSVESSDGDADVIDEQGHYQPKGCPQDQEMDSDSDPSELSHPNVHEKLAALPADNNLRRRLSDHRTPSASKPPHPSDLVDTRPALPSVATAPIPLNRPRNLPTTATALTSEPGHKREGQGQQRQSLNKGKEGDKGWRC
ncbi:uncharacterized protein STEHIDRAFT_116257 [Stereum hirsutum FP-91666 SS1]|uniref:Uncharacterized protein n=1 Tax=Stereum hirsutum (strain FP-91666) TaxID=721885 RepID=R7RWS7_STEHR|nr:uncharacterized protein STEHIDRAFT_116257 [Stereum hirsutum FP-91666 SS1]EIM79774.1 hypothetical protein STEHIDRAFT_116257 [Stereum hirsutum FP-91666 SS1]